MFDSILIADNDLEAINEFKLIFGKEYNMYFALNAEESLKILNRYNVKIFICDYQIESGNKENFLKIVADKYPQIVKIVLSSGRKTNSVINKYAKYDIFSFVEKPFNAGEIKNIVKNAIEVFNLKNQNTQLVQTLKRLSNDLSKYNEELEHENAIRKKAEKKLKKHKENLEKKIDERTFSLREANKELVSTVDELNNTNSELSATNQKLTHEINIRKKVESALKLSEEKFKKFLEQSNDSFIILDSRGRIVEWNLGSKAIYKITREEAIGKHIFEIEKSFSVRQIENRTERVNYKALVKEYFKHPSKYYNLNISGECQTLNNSLKFLSIHMFPIRTSNEVLIGRVGRDLTERRIVELELHEHKNHLQKMVEDKTQEIRVREETFRNVIENLPILINALNSDNKFVFWNKECERVTGYSAVEIVGNEKAIELLYPNKREREEMEKEYQEHKPYKNYPLELTDKSGKKRIIEWSNFPNVTLTDLNSWAVGIDVTEQKSAQQKIKLYQEQLEELVKERTKELNKANGKLREINEELLKKNYELEIFNKKLEESEKKVQSFIDQSSDGIAIIDENEKIIEFNSSLEKITGIDRKAVLGKNNWDFIRSIQVGNKSEKDASINKFRKLIDSGVEKMIPVNIESAIVNRRGETKHVQITAFPIKIGKNTHIGRIIRDITLQKQTEVELEQYRHHLEELINIRTEELQKSEQRLRAVSDSLPGGAIFRLRKENNRNYYLEFASARFTQITNVPVEKAAENLNNFFKVFHPDDFLKFKKRLRESSQKQTQLDAEVRILDKKGWKWLIIRSQPYGEENVQIYWDGIILDITDKKHAEEERMKSEANYRALFQQAVNGILVINLKGEITNASESATKITGYKKEELFLINVADIFNAGKSINNSLSDNNILSGKLINAERLIKKKNGEIIPIEMNARLIEDGRIQIFFRDISERKKAEKALKESELKFRNIFNSSIDGIVITNKNREFIETNLSFKRLTGYTDEELNSLTTVKITAPEYHNEINKRNTARTTFLPPMELDLILKSKELLPVEINTRRIKLDKQEVFLSIVRDIAERKNFERKMLDTIIQTEEKERERFAKNLHDDLGPLLSSIRMYVNTLSSVTEKEKYEFILLQVNEILKEAIQTTKDISNDLSPHILTNYGLVSAIDSFIQKLKTQLNIYFDSNLGGARLNNNIETTFYRIVKELVNNTLKHAEAKNIDINLFVENHMIKLEYSDDGVGFSPEEVNPKSYGMGIFNIKSRIKSLNGKFNFTNKEKGIMFEIEAPIDTSA